MGGCSSASSSVSEEEDGSVNITVITVVINSRTSVYLWLGGWLAGIYIIVRVYLLLQLRHPGCVPFRGIKTCWVPLGSHTINYWFRWTGTLARWILGGRDGRCGQRSFGVEIPGTGIREICGRDVFIYGASYADLLLIRTRILSSASAWYSDVWCMRRYPKLLYLSRIFGSCRMALLYFLSF